MSTTTSLTASVQHCYLERVPIQVFGEKVLQLLHARELMTLNDAITNHHLRSHWWLAGLLRFAINDCVPVTVRSNGQLQSLLTLDLRVSNFRLHLEDLNNDLVSELFACFGNGIHSIVISSAIDKKFRDGGVGSSSNPHLEVHIEQFLIGICDTLLPFAANFKSMKINATDDINDLHFPRLDHLLGSCSNLTCLDLRNILMTSACFSALLGLPPQLQSLTLSRTASYREADYWTSLSLADSSSVLPQILQRHCAPHLLTWLDLNDNLYQFRVTDACMDIIAAHCPLLEHLDIAMHDGPVDDGQRGLVTDKSLLPFAARCVRLKTAVMEGHLGISWLAVDALLSCCPEIRRIDVSYTSVTGRFIVDRRRALEEEGRQCRLCRKFNWRCNGDDDDGLFHDGGSDGDEEDGNIFDLDSHYYSQYLSTCPIQVQAQAQAQAQLQAQLQAPAPPPAGPGPGPGPGPGRL